jgi:Kef-type K+ transport system membrane component KefB
MSSPDAHAPSRRRLPAIAYVATTVLAVAAFLLIREAGERLSVPEVATAATPAQPANDTAPPAHSPARGAGSGLLSVLLALAAVIVSGRVVGSLFRYLGQPPVIGEVTAGLLLGPSFLGWIAPAAQAFLIPPETASSLDILAQVGVVLYMFVVGLELDLGQLRDRGHAVIAISHGSIVVPFLLGAALALALYPALSDQSVPFVPFALFLGAALSVTAFPVLARILDDRGMSRSPLGSLALTCAAANDATAWCLLAFVIGVAQSEVWGAISVAGLTLGYLGVMFAVVRPALVRLAPRILRGEPNRGELAIVLIGLLLSAIATELIGVHALFGAFVFGAVIPHDSNLARDVARKLEDFVSVLLLPAFFALTGLRTEIGLVAGLENWIWCGLIIVVATLGKFGGTLAAARLTGLGWREGSALGILMNTRGLMELIVLNIGLELRIISPTLFAMMVVMALVTTIATTPLLRLIWPEARSRALSGGIARD